MRKSDYVRHDFMPITPDLAEKWLAKNIGFNRKLSETTVEKYVSEIIRDAWNERSGETIKFDADGNLIDGQHRLTALVKTGRTLWMSVAYNCSREAFKTIDTGKNRGGADVLSILNEKNCNILASAVTLLSRYMADAVNAAHPVSNSEVVQTCEAHPDLKKSVHVIACMRSPKGFLAPSIAAFVHYMASRTSDEETATKFIQGVIGGDSFKNDSAMRVVRQRLIDNLASKAKLRRVDVIALLIKGWNCYRRGEQATSNKVRWRCNGDSPESFPKFAA